MDTATLVWIIVGVLVVAIVVVVTLMLTARGRAEQQETLPKADDVDPFVTTDADRDDRDEDGHDRTIDGHDRTIDGHDRTIDGHDRMIDGDDRTDAGRDEPAITHPPAQPDEVESAEDHTVPPPMRRDRA